jgi:hypothetical protein
MRRAYALSQALRESEFPPAALHSSGTRAMRREEYIASSAGVMMAWPLPRDITHITHTHTHISHTHTHISHTHTEDLC